MWLLHLHDYIIYICNVLHFLKNDFELDETYNQFVSHSSLRATEPPFGLGHVLSL